MNSSSNSSGGATPGNHDMNNSQNPLNLLQAIGTPNFVIPPQLAQSLTPQQLQLIEQKHQQMLLQRQQQPRQPIRTQSPQQVASQPQLPQSQLMRQQNSQAPVVNGSTPDYRQNPYDASPLPSNASPGSGMSNAGSEITQLPPQFRHLPPQMQQQVLFQLNQKKQAMQQQQQQQQYLQQQAQLKAQFQQQQQQAAGTSTNKPAGIQNRGKVLPMVNKPPTGKPASQATGNKGPAQKKNLTTKIGGAKGAVTTKGGVSKVSTGKKPTKKQQKELQKQLLRGGEFSPSSKNSTLASAEMVDESGKPLMHSSEVTAADMEEIRKRLPRLPPLPKYTVVKQDPEAIKLEDSSNYWSTQLKDEFNEKSSTELLNYEKIVLRDSYMLKQIQKEREGMSLSSKYGQSVKEYTVRFATDLKYYQDLKKTRLETIENIKNGKPTRSIWGDGFQGYANGVTNTETRVVLGDRNLTADKRSLYYDDISKIYDQAMNERQESLVPIRLDFEVEKDNFKMRDTFLLNINDDQTSIDEFVLETLKDYRFKNFQEHFTAISNSIREQISEYQEDPFVKISNFWRKNVTSDLNAGGSHNGGLNSIGGDDIRVKINIDIIIGTTELVDIIEWDISNPENSPEEFSTEMCKELRLPGEFATAISHQIREQVHMYHKALVLSGYEFDGSSFIEDDEIRSKTLPLITLDNALRNNSDIKNYTPNVFNVSLAELDRLDKDKEKEKDVRKRRRAGTQRINYNMKKSHTAADHLNDDGASSSSVSMLELLNGSMYNQFGNGSNANLSSLTVNTGLDFDNVGDTISSKIDEHSSILMSGDGSNTIGDLNMGFPHTPLESTSNNGLYLNWGKTPARVPNIFNALLNLGGANNNGNNALEDKDDELNEDSISTPAITSASGLGTGTTSNIIKKNIMINGLNMEDVEDLKPKLSELPRTFRTPIPTSMLPGGYDLGPPVHSYKTKFEEVRVKRPDPLCYILHDLNTLTRSTAADDQEDNDDPNNIIMEDDIRFFVKFKFKDDSIKSRLHELNEQMERNITKAKEEILQLKQEDPDNDNEGLGENGNHLVHATTSIKSTTHAVVSDPTDSSTTATVVVSTDPTIMDTPSNALPFIAEANRDETEEIASNGELKRDPII